MVQAIEKVNRPVEGGTSDFWQGKTPCWQTCHCPELLKVECPAPRYPSLPCWEIEGTYCKLTADLTGGQDTSICRSCRVYKRWGQEKPIELKLFGKGIDSFRRSLEDKAETAIPQYTALQSDLQMPSWAVEESEAKCSVNIPERRTQKEIGRLGKLDQIIDRYDSNRGALLEVMLDTQQEYGYLPKEALRTISLKLSVPLPQLYRVAAYYREAFSLMPRGRYMVKVCMDTACKERGAAKVLESLEQTLGIKEGETTQDGKFTLVTVSCAGRCSGAPVAKLDGRWHYGELQETEIRQVADSLK